MPPPPDHSLVLRLLLEEPLPLVIALGVAAVALLWQGLREGLPRRLAAGAGAAAIAVGVLAVAGLVRTPAERGAEVVRRLVAAVDARDAAAVDGLLAPEAGIHSGREENPGIDRRIAISATGRLGEWGVSSVSAGSVRAWPDGSGGAVVHLTVAARSDRWGTLASRWVLRARPSSSPDRWWITRLTWIDLMGSPPPAIPGR